MKFLENQYYRIFNRTNNHEGLFRTKDNYLFFLKKYRYYLDDYFDTIAYCLMPTHFHFLVRVKSIPPDNSSESYSLKISNQIAISLRSYTRAYNIKWERNGNLFTQKTHAKLIEDEKYFISLAFYIHQNPERSQLVDRPEDWEFSSYQDYINLRNGNLPDKELILSKFTVEDIKSIANRNIELPHSLMK